MDKITYTVGKLQNNPSDMLLRFFKVSGNFRTHVLTDAELAFIEDGDDLIVECGDYVLCVVKRMIYCNSSYFACLVNIPTLGMNRYGTNNPQGLVDYLFRLQTDESHNNERFIPSKPIPTLREKVILTIGIKPKRMVEYRNEIEAVKRWWKEIEYFHAALEQYPEIKPVVELARGLHDPS